MTSSGNKIGIYVAHDDDAILGVGGRIVQYLKSGDSVYIVICNDGRTSHKSVLGITEKPTMSEVAKKRKQEIKKAMKVIGLSEKNLYFLKLTNAEGRISENIEVVEKDLIKITKAEKPDVIYFHYPDGHREHEKLNRIMSIVLKKIKFERKVYQFVIWTKELSKTRSNLNKFFSEKISKKLIQINIEKELPIKRRALWEMKSQINIWSYWNWQVQKRPILEKKFIDNYLNNNEEFLEVS